MEKARYMDIDEHAREQMMKVLLERGSVRSFEDRPVPEDTLKQILKAGTTAATGGNLQPYSIINIREQATRDKLAQMCYQPFMAAAPVHLLFCIDWRRIQRWMELETAPFSANHALSHFWISIQDVMCTAQSISTAADTLGLGSVYIGTIMGFWEECRDMFDLPELVLPVVLVCMGYPKARPQPAKKLGPDVMVHDEKYRELPDEELLAAYNGKYATAMDITPERMERIREVCTQVHGKDFADKCEARIREQGAINAAKRYFGLHYVAHQMPLANEEMMAWIRKTGFRWFEKYVPECNS